MKWTNSTSIFAALALLGSLIFGYSELVANDAVHDKGIAANTEESKTNTAHMKDLLVIVIENRTTLKHLEEQSDQILRKLEER